MGKKIVAGLVLLTLVGVSSWYVMQTPEKSDTLTLYGNIDIRQISLAFDNNERITQMSAEEGDTVKAGQILATQETHTLTLQAAQAKAQIAVREQALLRLRNGSRPEEVAQAKAQLAAAQAEVNLATQQLKRLQNIATDTTGRGVSQQDLDSTTSQLRVTDAQLENRRKALELTQIGPRSEDIAEADAQLQVARAELALIQHRIGQAQLKAPLDAVIRTRLLEPGDMASPQRPVYTLAVTSPKWVRAYVTEPQLGHIKPGMPAHVTTDSAPEQVIAGHVGYISSVAEFTPKSVQTEELRTSLVYEVRILVDDPDNQLRLGMPATVRMVPQQNPTASSGTAPQ